jgi:alkylated DNA repair dioxygenase AlkB
MLTRVRTLLTEHTWIEFHEQWLPPSEAGALFEQLLRTLPFEQRSVTLFGKPVMQPRLIAWCGDVPYRYSGLTLPPREIPACLTLMMAKVSEVAGVPFNHVLLNLYRSGRDAMGMHADNERELGPAPVVATLSLGATRRFVLVARQGKHRAEYQLGDGSLLVMGGRCQTEYVHGIPKTHQPVARRLSLTFRHVVAPRLPT